ATGGYDFVAIKTERSNISECADVFSFVSHAHSLGRIFDNEKVVAAGNLHDLVNSASQTERVDGPDGANSSAAPFVEAVAVALFRFLFEKSCDFLNVDLPVIRIDIDQYWMRLAVCDRIHRCDECEIRNQDLIVCSYVDQTERDMQCSCSVS